MVVYHLAAQPSAGIAQTDPRTTERSNLIGARVVLYPGSAVAAGAVVEDDAVISQGVRVIGKHVPRGMIAFAGGPGELIFRPRPDDLLQEYFRL